MPGRTRTLLATLAGAGVAAAATLGPAIVSPRERSQARPVPLSAATLTGGTSARGKEGIPARDAPGVVLVRARRLAMARTPFDPPGTGRDAEASGSGFVVDGEGLIVAGAHVVGAATDIRVTFAGERTVAAHPVGKDPDTDVALLRVDPAGVALEPLALGDSGAVRRGDRAVAIAVAPGARLVPSAGVVSAVGRRLAAAGGFAVDDVILFDAAPATTGGPLLDAGGRVIGIVSQLWTGRHGRRGVPFAVPVARAGELIRELEREGRVERAYLGVHGTPAAAGLTVERLQPRSPAAAAGIRRGDVIAAAGGRAVRSMEDLSQIVGAAAPGTALGLRVVTGEGVRRLRATLALRPSAMPGE